MLALILVAVSLGLSNFAAAIGIGISGVSARTRLKVGIIFGLFEAGMPIAGLALGAFHVNLAVAAITIGGISVALSLIGLELGAQIGARTGQRGELLGGLVLIAVGAAIAAGLI